MADVTVYKRCNEAYFWSTQTIRLGEVRLASDAAVVANASRWVTLTDAELTDGSKGVHNK